MEYFNHDMTLLDHSTMVVSGTLPPTAVVLLVDNTSGQMIMSITFSQWNYPDLQGGSRAEGQVEALADKETKGYLTVA